VSLPIPRPGLVICYSYLWATEHRRGTEEGNKNRPCAIVAAHQVIEGREVVTVVPITHTRPAEIADAVEIPAALKRHLGLDDLPSWIVVTETNDFIWPGPDLHPVPGVKPSRFDYGMLPPRFFAHVRDSVLRVRLNRRLEQVPRTE
jgi:PemK-like, MazF-like toxin of type II toxin-antitoxin system